MSPPLAPGVTIGILGGGQLGRMLALAAAELGFDVGVFDPDPDCPAGRVAAHKVTAPYDDAGALQAFAARSGVVTFEFENIPVATLEAVAAHAPVAPGPQALALTQDRLIEKRFVRSLGLSTADFAAIDTPADLAAALSDFAAPSILKTRRFGYDGKGQIAVAPGADVAAVFAELGAQPAILEARVAFACEVSVVLARGYDGAMHAFDVTENHHEGGILRRSRVPAAIAPETATAAITAAELIAEALDYVGVLGVELFIEAHGGVRVNEIAPRVHNSGHWTQDACAVSQFAQHIRAIAGWPLAAPHRFARAEMVNLIGDDAADWRNLAQDPAARLHLYGKRKARPGRKMGHVTRIIRPDTRA